MNINHASGQNGKHVSVDPPSLHSNSFSSWPVLARASGTLVRKISRSELAKGLVG